MIRRPPISTRTDTLFPYTTLFRSAAGHDGVHRAALRLAAYLPLHRSAARVEPLVGAVLVLLAGEHLAAGVGGFLRRDAIFDGGAAHHLLHLLFHLVAAARHVGHVAEIGRASCRERVCQYV